MIAAISLGRRAISGTAETVIIKGVQKGEHRAAAYWLSHNDSNYMHREKFEHYKNTLDRDAELLKKPIVYDGSNFETLFKYLDEVEKAYEKEISIILEQTMVTFFCDGDTELIELCYASYEQWKIDREKEKKIEEDFGPDLAP